MMNQYMPLVSIIIPVFNGEIYLKKTIDSILGQTYQNIECIVIDDGSTDKSKELAESYGDKIIVYSINNSGQSFALNYGFERAKGTYIGYLSADDLIDNDHVSTIVSFIVARDSGNNRPIVAFTRYRFIDSDDNLLRDDSYKFQGVKNYIEEFNNLIGPGAIFSRSLFLDNGGWDYRFKQIPDYVFWLKNMSVAAFHQLDCTSASFRVHNNSQTYAQPSSLKSDESLLLIKIIEDGTISMPHGIDFQRFSVSALIFSSCLHIRGGRFTIAINKWFSAFKISPLFSLKLKNFKRIFSNVFHVVKLKIKSYVIT